MRESETPAQTKSLWQAARDAVSFSESHGVLFDSGLSDSEVDAAQRTFGFEFPPDLRAFLQTALPVRTTAWPARDPFPNWRSGEPAQLLERLEWPFEGIAFDIEHNVFWWDKWGPRPQRLEDALAVARRHVTAAPKLIPVCSHRYIPADPPRAGNPVFSVHQTDIIFYGTDLWDYFRNEFATEQERWQKVRGMQGSQYWAAHRPITFWSDLVRWNSGVQPDDAANAS